LRWFVSRSFRRDAMAKKYDLKLHVFTNPRGIEENIGPFSHGSRVHTQVIFALAMAASTLALELLLTPKFGLPAMIWSTNVSYLCFVLLPIILFFPRLLRTLTPSSKPVVVKAPFSQPAMAARFD